MYRKPSYEKSLLSGDHDAYRGCHTSYSWVHFKGRERRRAKIKIFFLK